MKLTDLKFTEERPSGFGFRPTTKVFTGLDALNFLRILHHSQSDYICTVECISPTGPRHLEYFRPQSFTHAFDLNGANFSYIHGFIRNVLHVDGTTKDAKFDVVYHPVVKTKFDLSKVENVVTGSEGLFMTSVKASLAFPKEMYDVEINDIDYPALKKEDDNG